MPVTGIRQAFVDLLGAKAAASWLQPDEFPRRFVATVDNLTREQAPSLLWPIEPTGGHFTVIEHQGRMVISPDNALRYAPFVQGLELVDTAQAVALYVRLLPMLQKAYEDLGFPGQRFHARLLNVIDHLLAAPDAPELINLKHTAVRGPIPSVTPWVRYEFADATMESASAGHKLMVRVGASHQRRLKAKLREFRAELARQASK